MTEAKRNEMKRSETEIPEALMTAMTTLTPAGDAAGGARCKRPGCAAPLPAQESGRARQFCGDECRRRHYNALRGSAAAVPPPAADGAGAALARLGQLLAEAASLALAAGEQARELQARAAGLAGQLEAALRRAADAEAARDNAARERDTSAADARQAAAALET